MSLGQIFSIEGGGVPLHGMHLSVHFGWFPGIRSLFVLKNGVAC